MYRCNCGKYTNYGPVCVSCAVEKKLEEGQESLEELEKEVEEILEED